MKKSIIEGTKAYPITSLEYLDLGNIGSRTNYIISQNGDIPVVDCVTNLDIQILAKISGVQKPIEYTVCSHKIVDEAVPLVENEDFIAFLSNKKGKNKKGEDIDYVKRFNKAVERVMKYKLKEKARKEYENSIAQAPIQEVPEVKTENSNVEVVANTQVSFEPVDMAGTVTFDSIEKESEVKQEAQMFTQDLLTVAEEKQESILDEDKIKYTKAVSVIKSLVDEFIAIEFNSGFKPIKKFVAENSDWISAEQITDLYKNYVSLCYSSL